jgi:hypothetical protein
MIGKYYLIINYFLFNYLINSYFFLFIKIFRPRKDDSQSFAIIDVDGVVFSSTDFVSSLIDLNRYLL